MDRERVLIGLWAMASACWICLVLFGTAAGSSQLAGTATALFAVVPPVLTIVCGYLISRVMRPPVEPNRGPDQPTSKPTGTAGGPPPALRTSRPLKQDP